MTILFAGAEDIDFNFVGGSETGYQHSGYIQTAYSRTSLRATIRLEAKKPFSATEAWLHFVTIIGTSGGSTTYPAWGFWSPELDNYAVTVHTNPGGRQALIRVNDGTGTYIDSALFSLPSVNEVTPWDLHVRIDGLSVLVELYNKEELVRRETFTLVQTYSLSNLRLSSGSAYVTWGWHYSQVIVATEPTLGWKLKTLAPAADGDLAEFTGTYADVDEVTLNNDDRLTTDVSAQSSFTAASWNVPGGFEVAGIAVSSYASSDPTGSKLSNLVRLNSQTFLSTEQDLTPGWANYSDLWEQNPETSADWIPADINGTVLQFGVGVTV